MTTSPSSTVRVLLTELIDYAGLFPPAALSMSEAAANYASYRDSADACALGRFVVPVARLDELAAESERQGRGASEGRPWRVSALAGENVAADADRMRVFNREHAGRLHVDTVELRASTPHAIEGAVAALVPGLAVYVELPVDADPAPSLDVVKRAGARAKVRTGGTTAEAFPTTPQLARFIARCMELGVPFKATAGLHHALRGEQPLTYAADAKCATMFGFLNVFLGALFAGAGLDEIGIARLLEERDSHAFELGDDAVRWRGRAASLDELRHMRASLATSFGSCSFREPLDELRQLGLL
jgi:hypothetical protein